MQIYWKRITWLLCAVLCAAFIFLLQYRYDNKYNVPGARADYGTLDLSTTGLEPPLHILAYGWEFYPQKLIAPGEFDKHKPDYLYLGQYGGFENGSRVDSPHGCATYRLNILLPDEEKEYALELPEIYTASRIWINGRLVSSLGELSDEQGQPVIRSSMATFQAASKVEIVVQAADYSHYYSGMVYPPAFGSVEALSDLLSFRFLRTCIMVISSFTIGIMYFVIGLRTGTKQHRTMLFSLTSLIFSIYVMYPLFHIFGAEYWIYRLEDMSFYLFLLTVTALHCSLCGISGRARMFALGFSGIAALLSLIVPALFLRDSLNAMMAYSSFLGLYKLVLFGWLITTAFFNNEKSEAMNGPLLAGLCVIAVSLLIQTLAPVFEPVRFGWQTEISGFVFILLLAAGLWVDTVSVYAERAALTENIRFMKKQFYLQEENYKTISANFTEIRRMRHDLRHHLNAVTELTRQKQYDELEHYVIGLKENTKQAVRPTLCENHAANAILNYYVPLAELKEINLIIKVCLPPDLKLEGWNLGLILGNLLENAIEASEKLPKEKRMVKVCSRISNGSLLLTVKNRWNGDFSASGKKIYSSKHEGLGIGLSSVRSLVEKIGGQLYLTPDMEEFQVSVVLWNQVSS